MNEGAELVDEERGGRQLATGTDTAADTEVRLFRPDGIEDTFGNDVSDLDGDGGMAFGEVAEDGRKEVRGDRWQHCNGDDATAESGYLPGAAEDGFSVDKETLERSQYVFTGSGEANAAFAAVEESDAECVFKLTNLNCKCGLRDMELGCGAGEVTEACRSEERADMAQVVNHLIFR